MISTVFLFFTDVFPFCLSTIYLVVHYDIKITKYTKHAFLDASCIYAIRVTRYCSEHMCLNMIHARLQAYECILWHTCMGARAFTECIHTCMGACAFTYFYECRMKQHDEHLHTCMGACAYIYMCVCVWVHVHIYSMIHVWVYVHIYIHVWERVHLHIP